jgi:hypothetical protein
MSNESHDFGQILDSESEDCFDVKLRTENQKNDYNLLPVSNQKNIFRITKENKSE